MDFSITISLVVLAVAISFAFATLTYSLRDFSRAKLQDYLARRGTSQWLDRTVNHASELAFVTAVVRLMANILVLIGLLHLIRGRGFAEGIEYLIAAGTSAIVTVLFSVVFPHAIANQVAEPVIAHSVRCLDIIRLLLRPMTRLLNVTERVVVRATTTATQPEEKKEKLEEELQSEILSVVEEGEKSGAVDKRERVMIESVIQFGDTTVAEVMTPRPEIVGLPATASLDKVRGLIEESGHSRLPIYENTVDHIVGVLYARDLLNLVGRPADTFDMKATMRPPFLVPETKPLVDLLRDFRLQKVHMAIALDEYGGTAGLVTIEDVLEQLVGEISDEHEPIEPTLFHRLDEYSADVDAKIGVDELNHLLGTTLPEDGDFETLGGYVSMHLGRIPDKGTEFEDGGATYTVLEAEPRRVTRVRVKRASPASVAPAT